MKKSQPNDIYGYSDYKAYLNASLPSKGEGRGARTRLAQALGCQPGFISLVLSGKGDLSLEHGIQVAQFLALDETEKDFLLLLIQKERAGSVVLKNHFVQQLKKIQSEKKEVKSRIQANHALSEEEQQQYYQSWYLTAIHMCTMIPSFRTPRAIAEYLHISYETARQAIEKLKFMGLVTQEGTQLKATQKRIHLGEKNLALKSHHTNWRLRALDSLNQQTETDLHYTSVMSISAEVAGQIRQLLLKSIQDSEPLIKGAQDEAVYTLAIDLFEANKN